MRSRIKKHYVTKFITLYRYNIHIYISNKITVFYCRNITQYLSLSRKSEIKQIMKQFFCKSIFTISIFISMFLNYNKSNAMGITERDKTYDIGICTDKGKVNPENEDTCGIFSIGQDIVCVVCDGVGGSAAGSTASRTAFGAVKEYLENNGLGSGLVEINKNLAASFTFADKKVREIAASDSLLKGMATTCLVAVIRNDTLYYAHAGDCRLYTGDFSKLEQMTEDDSYINMLLADGEITKREAKRHPLRRAIINAIGSKSNELYVNSCENGVPIQDDTYYLMCSDGLYEELSVKRIRKIIKQNAKKDSNSISKELVQSANKAGGNDNISVILIRRIKNVIQLNLQ